MNFEMPKTVKTVAIGLSGLGLVVAIAGFVMDGQRTWASLLLNNFFFLGMAVTATFFLAINYVSNAGWYTVIKRIPESMGMWLPVASILMILIFLGGGHSIYHWTHHDLYDPSSHHYDELIANKSAYLNTPFFLIRMVVFLGVWCLFVWLLRRNSIKSDSAMLGDYSGFKKNFRLSAAFLVFFMFTSSVAGWDWIMSIDTHWFSTLFGWFMFSGMFVSGLVGITLISIFLKSKGYLKEINKSHLHDLGKYIFAFSIFWAYLWFSQFMLIWYSNIPEEITYYLTRFEDYQVLFLLSFGINFVVPLLALMTADSKKKMMVLTVVCVTTLIGQWMNLFVMIMPGAVGITNINFVDIGLLLGFSGMFTFVSFYFLSKASLVPKNNPYLDESLHHHSA